MHFLIIWLANRNGVMNTIPFYLGLLPLWFDVILGWNSFFSVEPHILLNGVASCLSGAAYMISVESLPNFSVETNIVSVESHPIPVESFYSLDSHLWLRNYITSGELSPWPHFLSGVTYIVQWSRIQNSVELNILTQWSRFLPSLSHKNSILNQLTRFPYRFILGYNIAKLDFHEKQSQIKLLFKWTTGEG